MEQSLWGKFIPSVAPLELHRGWIWPALFRSALQIKVCVLLWVWRSNGKGPSCSEQAEDFPLPPQQFNFGAISWSHGLGPCSWFEDSLCKCIAPWIWSSKPLGGGVADSIAWAGGPVGLPHSNQWQPQSWESPAGHPGSSQWGYRGTLEPEAPWGRICLLI